MSSIVRNLIMHIWPVANRGVWQWNVKQLMKRIDQFNGQRVVSIVTGPNTDSFENVKQAFKGTVTNFIHLKNDPTLGEVVSFAPLLKRVDNCDPRQITFYCHAKGVKYALEGPGTKDVPGSQPMVRHWTSLMWSNMLDYPKLIDDALRDKVMVGSFKKMRGFIGPGGPTKEQGHTPFHYAGTFFWFKNDRIFGQSDYHRIPNAWWGVEAWPGIVVHSDQAATLFMSDNARDMTMYQEQYWNTKLFPAWKDWRIKHAGLHRHCSLREVLNSLTGRTVVVSGPQRSGTMIASKILAYELHKQGFEHLDEQAFNSHNTVKFMDLLQRAKNAKPTVKFVIQAPGMSPYLHSLQDVDVVWMRRDLQDVLRSQKRINWTDRFEETERDKYFDHSHDPMPTVKTRAWEHYQRVALGESAWDLDYSSLSSHQLWVDPDKRVGFKDRQTCPYDGSK